MKSPTSRLHHRQVACIVRVLVTATSLVGAACGRDVLIGIETIGRHPAGTGGTSGGSGGAGSTGGTGGVVTSSGGVFGGTGGAWAGSGGNNAPSISCPTISTTIGQLNPCGRTMGVAFSPDGRLLASATETVGGSATPFLHVWRLSDGALLSEPTPEPGSFYDLGACSVAFSPDGTLIATAGHAPRATPFSNTVKLWDTATGALLKSFPTNCGQDGIALGFSHDGTRLVTAGARGGVEVWSIPGGTLLLTLPFYNTVYTAYFSPDDTRLITASLMIGTVWDASTGTKIFDIPGLEGEMNAAAYSPNGQMIVATADEGKVKVLDAAGILLQTLTFKPATTPYFSNAVWIDDSRFVVDDWSGAVKEWTADGSGTFVQSRAWSLNTQTLGMAVSPDRTTLVVGGDAGFVFLSP